MGEGLFQSQFSSIFYEHSYSSYYPQTRGPSRGNRIQFLREVGYRPPPGPQFLSEDPLFKPLFFVYEKFKGLGNIWQAEAMIEV